MLSVGDLQYFIGNMPRLPKITRENFVFHHETLGWSFKKIAVKLKKSERTVYNWYRIWKTEKRLTKNISPGRPRVKRSTENLQRLKRHVLGRRTHTLREISRNKPEFGSKSTIYRALREDLNLQPLKKKRCPQLTEEHKAKRLRMAEEHVLNDQDVRNWVFTDEKQFSFIQTPGRNDFIWTDDLQDDRRFFGVPKYQKKSVEVWAGITYFGVTKLYFIERTTKNKEKEKFTAGRFLDEILRPALKEIQEIFATNGVNDWVFQQDGDSKHTAAVVQGFLQKNTPAFINKEEWPPNSPDLNLIENLWKCTVDKLKSRHPQTLESFKRMLQKEWRSTELEVVRALFDSWSDRMNAVLEANGGHTKY